MEKLFIRRYFTLQIVSRFPVRFGSCRVGKWKSALSCNSNEMKNNNDNNKKPIVRSVLHETATKKIGLNINAVLYSK